jgi:hypothetical protein
MSTEVSIFENDLPVEHRATQELSELAKSLLGNRTVYTNRRIVVKKGTFRKLINGDESGNRLEGPLNVIIVNALPGISRQFYAAEYDPEAEASLPDCYSNLGEVPEKSATNPQSANCATCPRNVDGPKGRECKFQRRIAVVLEGDPNGDVYQFNLGSKSIFGKAEGKLFPFEAYLKHLVSHGESIDRVVTSICIDDNVDYAKVFFKAERHLTPQEEEVATRAGASRDAKNVISLSVGQTDGAKKLSSPSKAESDEPVKRQSAKPTVAPVEEKKLSDVVSAWSEE